MDVKVKRFDNTLPLPEYDGRSACFDLICRTGVEIKPGEIKLVPVNIAVKVPDGYALLLLARSSTPIKKGLMMANGVGVIDPFYCGDMDEIQIELLNITKKTIEVIRGSSLVQGMFVKHDPVTWKEVARMGEAGAGGFGVRQKKD